MFTAKPHSSVGIVQALKIGGLLFDPWLGQCAFQGLMIVYAIGFIPLSTAHCFDNGYVGKQPYWFDPLPDHKISDWSKFKAFADDKIILTQKWFVLGGVENSVGKGENAGYQHFLFFPQCFQNLSFPEVLKVGIVW